MLAGALEMAGEIAARSPVAVQGTKINLLYARDHSVAEGLNYMVGSSSTKPWFLFTSSCHSFTIGTPTIPIDPFPGHVEHEHASDSGSDEIGSGCHGEETPQDNSFLQTLNSVKLHLCHLSFCAEALTPKLKFNPSTYRETQSEVRIYVTGCWFFHLMNFKKCCGIRIMTRFSLI